MVVAAETHEQDLSQQGTLGQDQKRPGACAITADAYGAATAKVLYANCAVFNSIAKLIISIVC